MKIGLTLSCIIFSFLGICQNEVINKDTSFWPNGNLETTREKGKRGGVIWKTYYENGVLESYTEDTNNKQHGNVRFYYPSGKLQTDCNYVRGKLHGKCIQYYESGQVLSIAKFKNGLKHGPIQMFTNDGKESYYKTYKNGEEKGPYRLYGPDGEIRESGVKGE